MIGTRSPSLPLFERSQVAQHNDDAHGYWLIIDELVYDVSEFMSAHPAGPRILQLYAGRDATRGFERVHRDRDQIGLMLARTRIGALREPECATRADHAAHRPAACALDSALGLVVEMQNALRADHAFQLLSLHTTAEVAAPTRRSRYELQRGLETHARFHREYLDVLIGASLTSLASSILPAQEIETGWRSQLGQLQDSPESTATRAGVLDLIEQFERFADHELTTAVACFEVLDSWLLRMWKRELLAAVRCFERSHAATLQLSDSPSVYGVCERLIGHVREYFRNACTVTERSTR